MIQNEDLWFNQAGPSEDLWFNKSGVRPEGRVRSDFSSREQVRRLQHQYPYKGNEKKPWWKCGCSGGGVGGCVKGACIGPGTITINF